MFESFLSISLSLSGEKIFNFLDEFVQEHINIYIVIL